MNQESPSLDIKSTKGILISNSNLPEHSEHHQLIIDDDTTTPWYITIHPDNNSSSISITVSHKLLTEMETGELQILNPEKPSPENNYINLPEVKNNRSIGPYITGSDITIKLNSGKLLTLSYKNVLNTNCFNLKLIE